MHCEADGEHPRHRTPRCRRGPIGPPGPLTVLVASSRSRRHPGIRKWAAEVTVIVTEFTVTNNLFRARQARPHHPRLLPPDHRKLHFGEDARQAYASGSRRCFSTSTST